MSNTSSYRKQLRRNVLKYCVALIVVVSFSGLSLSSFATPQKLTCSVNGAFGWYPIIYSQEQQVKGLAADVLTLFEAKHGVEFIFGDALPWVRLEDQLLKGELDIIAGAYFNKQRQQQFIYSVPFHKESINLLVVRQSHFRFDKLEDLIGHLGMRPAGGSYGETFDTFARDNLAIQQIHNPQTMFRMLLGNRGDYIVLAKFHGLSLLKQLGLKDKIDILAKPVAQNNIHFMFSKKSDCLPLLNQLNNFIAATRSTANWQKVLSRY